MKRNHRSISYGCLRSLEERDAPKMLEWMHDERIASVFQADFMSMELEDVLAFIRTSQDTSPSLHLAIVNDDDEYMGTISLKNIDEVNGSAEYAISMRACAQGTGLSQQATLDILRYAFNKKNLHRVFLNVRSDNIRARRFYEKVGFVFEGTSREALLVDQTYFNLEWFSMLDSDFRSLQ